MDRCKSNHSATSNISEVGRLSMAFSISTTVLAPHQRGRYSIRSAHSSSAVSRQNSKRSRDCFP